MSEAELNQKNFIPLPGKPQEKPSPLATKEELKKQGKEISRLDTIMKAILAVLFVGFLTMLIGVASMMLETWLFKANTYKEYKSCVEKQEEIINKQETFIKEQTRLLNNYSKQLDDMARNKKKPKQK